MGYLYVMANMNNTAMGKHGSRRCGKGEGAAKTTLADSGEPTTATINNKLYE